MLNNSTADDLINASERLRERFEIWAECNLQI
jgi:hypothetical protein